MILPCRMRVSAGALYLSAPEPCDLRMAGLYRKSGTCAGRPIRKRRHGESPRSRTGPLTTPACVSPRSPVLPWPGILQPQCEVCDDTVASIHCQVGSVVWRTHRLWQACCLRAPAHMDCQRTNTSQSLGLVIFQTRPLTGVNVRLHAARARSLARDLGQECRRKTCEECDEILHLVCTHTQLIACMHARARAPALTTKISATCSLFPSLLVAESSLSMHSRASQREAPVLTTHTRSHSLRGASRARSTKPQKTHVTDA